MDNGIVFALSTLAFVEGEVERAWVPNNIDIIVPNGKGATLIQLLVDHGFLLVRSLVASCYNSVVTSRYVMIRDGGEKKSQHPGGHWKINSRCGLEESLYCVDGRNQS
jgi:hypothetical protein